MFWRRAKGLDSPQLFRLVHERWLSRAIRSNIPYPRIPIRRVDQGGFEAVRTRPEARDRADRWWSLALDRVDSGHLGPLDPPTP